MYVNIKSLSSAHRFGLYKSAAAPRLAANHSHPCSQLGRWLADWLEWQPITAILAASLEGGLLIGQFLAGVPNQAANHRQDHSQFRKRLADWPVSGMPSHVPAYS